MTDPTLIEIDASVHGGSIPHDHRYLLHSAVKTQCCRRLTERDWQLRAIQGGDNRDGVRVLEGADATLQARVPKEDLDDFFAIEDAPLRLGDHIVMVEVDTVRTLRPSDEMHCDCVWVDKGGAGTLGAYVGKALGAQFGRRDFGVVVEERVPVQVQGTGVQGSRVRAVDVTDEESLWLQRHPTGQKASWGCGTWWREP